MVSGIARFNETTVVTEQSSLQEIQQWKYMLFAYYSFNNALKQVEDKLM